MLKDIDVNFERIAQICSKFGKSMEGGAKLPTKFKTGLFLSSIILLLNLIFLI